MHGLDLPLSEHMTSDRAHHTPHPRQIRVEMCELCSIYHYLHHIAQLVSFVNCDYHVLQKGVIKSERNIEEIAPHGEKSDLSSRGGRRLTRLSHDRS